MRNPVSLDSATARAIVLQSQGLLEPMDSLAAIRQLSYIQIDTISVAERSHHHVFYSRNPNYHQDELARMMSNKQVFEYWSHAAAYLPMDDYRFSLYMKGQVLKADKFWFEKDRKVMRHVLRRIKAEGPLQSKDFDVPKKGVGTWYEWKPTKIALQLLFMEGRIMIAERQGFQKVFDLTERVLPEGTDTRKPTEKGFYTYLVDRAVDAHGIIAEEEIRYLRKGSTQPVQRVLKEKLRTKELIKVTVSGLEKTYYTRPPMLEAALPDPSNKRLHLLNPFDNLVIQRNRLSDLFGFEYLIECYVPEAKRRWGYYTLPLLYGHTFVGRLDPKVNRKTKTLTIQQIWFEEGFIPDDAFWLAFAQQIRGFARFCACRRIALKAVTPNRLFQKVHESCGELDEAG